MKKLFIALISALPFCSLAQINLVPNPSFEDTVNCPYAGNSLIDAASGWMIFRETPDYFNNCANSTDPLFGIPTNFGGNQFPLHGNAYFGIQTYVEGVSDYREIGGNALTSALIIGQKYFVTFYVVNAGVVPGIGFNCSTNKLGIRFSTAPYASSTPTPINNFSHIYTNTNITDSVIWQSVSGSFTADSAYQYIAIGNFFDDANTDTLKFNSWACRSYYLIDGVCVSTDSIYASNWLSTVNYELSNTVKIYPNPTNNILNIQSDLMKYSITVQNIAGQILFKEDDPKNRSVDVSNFPSGIYIIQINSNMININKKLIIDH